MTFAELYPNWIELDMNGLSGLNTRTFAVDCNSAIWAVLLCVSTHKHRVPFLGIQPSNVPPIGSLEQLATLPRTVDDR